MHDLRSGRGHLEHFIVGNFRQLARVFHDPRVAGVNAIDIGEDLADIGLQRRGDRNRREVGSAATQGVNHAIGRDPLESGDHQRFAFVEEAAHQRGIHVENATAGVRAGGVDASLTTGDRHRIDAKLAQSHRDQRNRLLLAGSQQHIEFAFAGITRKIFGHLDEAIGHARHRGNHCDHLIARIASAFDARGDIAHAIDRADGSAAVFLNDEGHGWSRAE